MTRLPGAAYAGDDVDGYETAAQVVERLRSYGRSFNAPVVEHTAVGSIRSIDGCFVTRTDRGEWLSDAVVVASGGCSVPRIPACAEDVPANMTQLSPIHYRNPAQLSDGGVVIVGASASGVQLADELTRAGRDVTICVGSHKRLPRTYRGRDVLWWLNHIGQLDELAEHQVNLTAQRCMPSMQLVGSPENRTLDLNALSAQGVQLVGRLERIELDGGRSIAHFDSTLASNCRAADLGMHRLLGRIDEFIEQHDVAGIAQPDIITSTIVDTPPSHLDLDGIGTIIWATGFQPDYPWLDPTWLDERGAINHHNGTMVEQGMYVLGLPFLRRRKSNFIDGVGIDAAELADRLVANLQAATQVSVRSA